MKISKVDALLFNQGEELNYIGKSKSSKVQDFMGPSFPSSIRLSNNVLVMFNQWSVLDQIRRATNPRKPGSFDFSQNPLPWQVTCTKTLLPPLLTIALPVFAFLFFLVHKPFFINLPSKKHAHTTFLVRIMNRLPQNESFFRFVPYYYEDNYCLLWFYKLPISWENTGRAPSSKCSDDVIPFNGDLEFFGIGIFSMVFW